MWLKDPKNGKPSVSLTLLMISVFLMVIFIFLEAFEVMQSTSLLDELFITSVSLYFGRRFSMSSKPGFSTNEPLPGFGGNRFQGIERKYGHNISESL